MNTKEALETLRKVIAALTVEGDPAKQGRDAAHQLLAELLNQTNYPTFVVVPDNLRQSIYELWTVDNRCGRGMGWSLESYVQNHLLWRYNGETTMPNVGNLVVYATPTGELEPTGCSLMTIHRTR